MRPAPLGFAVGYPEPLSVGGPDAGATAMWAVVTCEPDTKVFTIADIWTMWDPDFMDGSVRTVGGRRVAVKRVREFGTLPDGTRGVVRVREQSTRVLHAAIREPAALLGWQERQPASVALGKVVVTVIGTLLVLGALYAGWLGLTGQFS
ncbi:hypothetical protein [Cellulomonas bogoriensis]|uniref:hypothetical protein n=1 Tax=Cellulomonas bogoriensis TaxID=301388 RepID=UPI0012EB1296|nr:hypothetical protein [Cellulomonas bogoriensis]